MVTLRIGSDHLKCGLNKDPLDIEIVPDTDVCCHEKNYKETTKTIADVLDLMVILDITQ